uniref:Protein kinase domain-containing protein n=1 Tax=Auxenochlorella protothecoides TaxID=3075 RepID=A0A1D1ZVU6_AUXPR
MTETRPSTAVRHISAVQRVEELEISLQAAHEVNAHLNGEVEKLTARVTALEGERGAFQQRIHLLSRKLAAARRDAGLGVGSGPAGEGPLEAPPDAGPLAGPGPGAADAAPRSELDGARSANDDPALRAWLPGTAWREAEARAREQGWLVDPREVALGPLLGQGTFGTTHRATWRGAAVAVKRVRVADAEGGAMFLREVAALRRLRHPHVMGLWGACLADPGAAWLLCELLPGGTLAAWLHGAPGALRAPRRPRRARLQALLDVARGMLALEAADPPVLHRDLKPSNVFLDAHGAAKVADMGLARVLEPGAAACLTGETGTYSYMSPECVRHEVYGPRSDVWSWGVMAVELLSQRRPYADLHLTPVQVAMEVGAGTLCPEIPSDCPEELAGLLHAAFHPDPIERPSFGAIVAGMARVVEAEARGGEGGGGGGDWLAQGKWGLPTRLTGLLRG